MDINRSVSDEHRDINNDPAQYLDAQQRNSMMALKVTEHENALTKRDYVIKSLNTDMMNSQNNKDILANHYKTLTEKGIIINNSCNRLNTNYTNIFERLNRLENIAENVRTGQKEVVNTVKQTSTLLEEEMLSNFHNSLNELNSERIRAKQKLEVLENRYYHQINAYKINSDECTKELNNLKSEKNCLLAKIKEENIKLKEEKEIALSHNYNFEKQLEEMKSQNALLNDKYESINVKYEEMLTENQSLKDELIIMKTSLDENSNMLGVQLNKIKEQTELLNNLKVTEEMNELLKIDNRTIEERNRNLEKINADLMDKIKSNKIYHNKSEELKTKFEDMCTTYDNLLKMQENKLIDVMEKLELQKTKKDDVQSIIIGLEEKVAIYTKTTLNLEEKVNASDTFISRLQSTIETLNKYLTNAYQKLQDSTKEYATENNELVKEKTELENKTRDRIEEIKKLKSACKKFKLKADRRSEEIKKLHDQFSRLEPNKTNDPNMEVIELISDDEETIIIDHPDVDILEFDNRNVSNINIGLHSTSNTVNQSSECTSLKRLSSPSKHVTNIKTKEQRIDNNIDASHSKVNRKSEKIKRLGDQFSQSEPNKTDIPNMEVIELISDDEETIIDHADVGVLEFDNRNVSNINIGLHSTSNPVSQSSKCTSLKRLSSSSKHVTNIQTKKQRIDNNIDASQESIEFNQSVLNTSHSTLSQQKVSNNENKVQSVPYTGTYTADNKKIFEIPDFLRPTEKRRKSKNLTK